MPKIHKLQILSCVALLALHSQFGEPLGGCPICVAAMERQTMMVEQLAAAQDVVLVRRCRSGELEVSAVLKGDPMLKGSILPVSEPDAGGVMVFRRDSRTGSWLNLGNYNPRLPRFFEAAMNLSGAEPLSHSDWTTRLEVLQPFLGHPEPRISSSAWASWVRAPREVLKEQAVRVSREDLRRWLADPTTESQHGLWLTLLGFNGNEEDVEWLEGRLRAGAALHQHPHLAELFGAYLTRTGEAGIALIAELYLHASDRTLRETRTALSALSVYSVEASPQARSLIIESFRRLVEERPTLAGFAARDLARWKQWDLEPKFRALQSNLPLYPEAWAAMGDYLRAWEQQH
jgi:hypothetical protein